VSLIEKLKFYIYNGNHVYPSLINMEGVDEPEGVQWSKLRKISEQGNKMQIVKTLMVNFIFIATQIAGFFMVF
jgi:hypothetical protein